MIKKFLNLVLLGLVYFVAFVVGVALFGAPFAADQFSLMVTRDQLNTHGLVYPVVFSAVALGWNLLAEKSAQSFRRWRNGPGRWRKLVSIPLSMAGFFAGAAVVLFVLRDDSSFANILQATLAAIFVLWIFVSRTGSQTRSVAAVGISTLTQRMGSSVVIVVGIAGVVGVLVALLAMAQGYAETLRNSGSLDTAIVMRGASANEVSSSLSREDIVQIEQAPGVARNNKGEPILSAETVVAANLPVKGSKTGDTGSAQVRGVSEAAFAVRPSVKIIEGKAFQPGLREIIVGKGAVRQFDGLTVGSSLKLGNQPWTIVGVFASGDAMESELWADANVVNDTYKRGSGRNSATVRLESRAAIKAFSESLENNPQLKVKATTTLAFFSKQGEQMIKVLRIIGITVGSIMAVGAVFGALNTMFAAVATRAREIATLRAIGFRGLPVVVAVMLETTLLALIGGLIGGAIAWLLFNGFEASTMSAGSVGKLSFNLAVSPGLLWEGIKWALAIGFVGGLFPAVRAASLPVTTALREA